MDTKRLHKKFFLNELEEHLQVTFTNVERIRAIDGVTVLRAKHSTINITTDNDDINNNGKEEFALRVIDIDDVARVEMETDSSDIVIKLAHENIVEIVTYYEGTCYLYVVMPFYRFGDLKQISANYELNTSLIVSITYQLSKALKRLHQGEMKIVHRDIALDNIFVELFDFNENMIQVRLADFELCESIDTSTKTTSNVGRLMNNPPSINHKHEIGSSSDIWCLGAVIYRLITRDNSTNFSQFTDQSDISELIFNNSDTMTKQRLEASGLQFHIFSCLKIRQEERISSRALNESLLFTCISHKVRTNNDNQTLLKAFSLMCEKETYADGELFLEKSLNRIPQEDFYLTKVLRLFSPNITKKDLDDFEELDSFLAYFFKAYAYSELNETEKAIENYIKAIELNPIPYNNRSNIIESLEDYVLAIIDSTKAIELAPKTYLNWYNRGNYYRNTKNYLKSIYDYSMAINIDPSDKDCFYARGLSYFELEEYEKAIEDFTIFIGQGKKQIEFEHYYKRGIAFKNVEEYRKAINDFCKAIEIDSNNFNAYLDRGNCYLTLDQYNLAIEDFSKCIELESEEYAFYFKRGITYFLTNEYTKSVDDLTIAIQLNKDNPGSYYYRGFCFKCMEIYSSAIEDFSKAIELNENAEYYLNRANVYENIEKFECALEDYSKSINLEPTFESYRDRGALYLSLHQYEKSIEDLTKAIELDSSNENCFSNRGLAYFKNDEYDKAIIDYTMAIRMNPENDRNYLHRSVCYYKLENYYKSMDDCDMSIKLNPMCAVAYYNRGSLFRKLDDLQKTLKNYSQAISLDSSIYCSTTKEEHCMKI